ncbi:MAG: amidohydrolase family protein [Chloroflexi bacterium]|nr:amidohydrolase family protein [Chloroflexota bacterium]MBV9892589.1 amidohydrolase family protein [Chloroflexota bacterium]
MPTMDFEVYLDTNVSAVDRSRALQELFENEDAAGIEYAVVMPSPTPKPDNAALFETAHANRRAVLCCQVNPNFGDPAFAEIRRARTEFNMRILKIMPAIYQVHLTGPLAKRLMDTARELQMVVNIHSGSEISHPLAIGAIARRYPDVPILMDHMGYREWTSDAIEAARDNPNLYLGTTIAAVEPTTVERAVRELGPERVVFGSNWPNVYADLAAEAIRRRRLGTEVEELIFGGNLARILGFAP